MFHKSSKNAFSYHLGISITAAKSNFEFYPGLEWSSEWKVEPTCSGQLLDSLRNHISKWRPHRPGVQPASWGNREWFPQLLVKWADLYVTILSKERPCGSLLAAYETFLKTDDSKTFNYILTLTVKLKWVVNIKQFNSLRE